MPTIPEIMSIAPIAQYLAQVDIQKNGLHGGGVNIELPNKIYNIRRAIERVYNDDPTDTTLRQTVQYLYTLLGMYGQQALVVTESPGFVPSVDNIVVGSIKSPIRITGADFANATEWDGVNSDSLNVSAGYTLQVFWNDVNRFLEAGEWQRTTLGIEILLPGFDATTTNLTSVFYIFISV